jgi:adenylate kinase
MIIIVTGTPGTGKTHYAKKLANDKNYCYIDVNALIKKYNLSEEYDDELSCDVVDTDKLAKVLIEMIKHSKDHNQSLVIDSHFSHYIPKEYVDKCIVMRCSNIKELRKRLSDRGYSDKKIEQNIEAEIMETCKLDAEAAGHKIKVVYTDTFAH